MAEKKKTSASSDVFTAILGMALLILIATTAFVCVRGQQLWGEIFKIVEL
jgi:hypothetical protein